MRVLVKRLLKKYKYPPEGQEQALQVVMEQCNKWADDEENYEDKKLLHVEDDSDVRNLIYNRLQIDKEVSDLALQREVIEMYGERYPGMSPNDWRHIIEYYTSQIRKAHQEAATEIPMDFPKAAEDIE